MCMNFIYYYPRLEKFTDCRSEVSEAEYQPFYESLFNEYLLNMFNIKEKSFSNFSYALKTTFLRVFINISMFKNGIPIKLP